MLIESSGSARRRLRSGGVLGNEILTAAIAALLVLLLLAEGVTILDLGLLLRPHMFIGLVLVPPLLVKLGSTGYRFARYYTRSPGYREKGPPLLPLRLLAPALVLATVAVFATGIALLVLGRPSGELLFLHKLSFIAWGLLFGVHFLAYAPRVARSLLGDWSPPRRRAVGGAGLRAALVAATLGGGVALALALLPTVDAWQPAGF